MLRSVNCFSTTRHVIALCAVLTLSAACADPTTAVNDDLGALDSTSAAMAKGGARGGDSLDGAISGGSIVLQLTGLPSGVAASVKVSGPRGYVTTVTGSTTLSGLRNGTYTVTTESVTVSGTNYSAAPATQSLSVSKGNSVSATVEYSAVVTTGSMTLTVTAPTGVTGAVTITGPSGYTRAISASTTLTDLGVGTYTITAADVTLNGARFAPSPSTQSVSVTTGTVAAASVSYAATSLPPGSGLNLHVSGMYLTQSIQTMSGAVPLVAGRSGVLRVFVLANEANAAQPIVRARVFRNGTLMSTLTSASPSSSVPLTLSEGSATSSWNFAIAGSLIQGGMSILVDVDPGNLIAESSETDNQFPANGVAASFNVRAVPDFNLRFVPVKQGASGTTGAVSSANAESFLQPVRDMHPVNTITHSVRAAYTTSYAVSSGGDNWSTVLSELNALRAADGSAASYYGVLNVGYTSGVAGIGYLGSPVSMGWDKLPSGGDVMAHELGHNWSRRHAPCGGVSNPDASFPYSGGVIGAYGFNVRTGALVSASVADLMGYCSPTWISDYTYTAVMNFRGSTVASTTTSMNVQPGVLVWGRVEPDGSLVLEPVMRVTGPSVLPARAGNYVVQGRDDTGNPLFSLSFEPDSVFDETAPGGQHFAFVVPLADAQQMQLSALEFRGRGRSVQRRAALPAAALENAAAAAGLVASGPGRARLQWNAAALPMVMVRSLATGEVLSFARGGDQLFETNAADVELVVSDGVRSVVRRARVGGR